MKVVLDTNIYLGAFRSDAGRERFRATFFPLLPHTYLSAVVSYELTVNAIGRRTRERIGEFIRPMEQAGRLVTPVFTDWADAADVLTAIHEKNKPPRSKLPGLLNDPLIALSARRVGATVITYNGDDFRLIREHREFRLRVLAE